MFIHLHSIPSACHGKLPSFWESNGQARRSPSHLQAMLDPLKARSSPQHRPKSRHMELLSRHAVFSTRKWAWRRILLRAFGFYCRAVPPGAIAGMVSSSFQSQVGWQSRFHLISASGRLRHEAALRSHGKIQVWQTNSYKTSIAWF